MFLDNQCGLGLPGPWIKNHDQNRNNPESLSWFADRQFEFNWSSVAFKNECFRWFPKRGSCLVVCFQVRHVRDFWTVSSVQWTGHKDNHKKMGACFFAKSLPKSKSAEKATLPFFKPWFWTSCKEYQSSRQYLFIDDNLHEWSEKSSYCYWWLASTQFRKWTYWFPHPILLLNENSTGFDFKNTDKSLALWRIEDL